MSALKHMNCPLKRFDVFVMIYCRILCQLDTTAKECLLDALKKRIRTLNMTSCQRGTKDNTFRQKAHIIIYGTKGNSYCNSNSWTLLSIPGRSSHPKAWQIIITLSSILLFTSKLNSKRPETGRKPTSIVVAGSHITWIHVRPAQLIRLSCAGDEQEIRKFLCSGGRKW